MNTAFPIPEVQRNNGQQWGRWKSNEAGAERAVLMDRFQGLKASAASALLYWGVVQTRIKPYQQQLAEQESRAEQRRVYRRNQVFGLLMVAAAICAWWLFHTNPKWIFPSGWWR